MSSTPYLTTLSGKLSIRADQILSIRSIWNEDEDNGTLVLTVRTEALCGVALQDEANREVTAVTCSDGNVLDEIHEIVVSLLSAGVAINLYSVVTQAYRECRVDLPNPVWRDCD